MAALDLVLQRPSRTPWQDLMHSPILHLAKYLYCRSAHVRVEPTPSPANPVTVICVSDTHNYQPCLPPGDILIHAGDLTQSGTYEELQAALNWLKRQPCTYKIVVTGNHDVLLDKRCDRGGNKGELRQRLD